MSFVLETLHRFTASAHLNEFERDLKTCVDPRGICMNMGQRAHSIKLVTKASLFAFTVIHFIVFFYLRRLHYGQGAGYELYQTAPNFNFKLFPNFSIIIISLILLSNPIKIKI